MTKTLTLNNNHKMPVLGLGTWRSEKGLVAKAVEKALLKDNYKHIDCAAVYGNEPEIGGAFKKVFSSGKVAREDVFITSKLWNTEHDPKNVEKACKKTLADLNLNYLDLYLIHWGIPFAHDGGSNSDGSVKTEKVSIQDTWKAMEALVKKGLVKSIGVSNFTTPMILDLLSYAEVKPAINQIEVHPYNSQEDLINYCHKQDVHITAYSPLGSTSMNSDRPLENKVVVKIAKNHGKSPAQVLIRWSIQRGLVVIPKTTHLERLTENIDVFDFELTDDDMKKINALNKNYRFVDPSDSWGIPYFK